MIANFGLRISGGLRVSSNPQSAICNRQIDMAFIRLESGPNAGEVVPLDKARIVFGRHVSCDSILMHPTVSREHFFIERHGAKYVIADNDSGNGTFVNGERVTWVELKGGETIQAGPFKMIFEPGEGEPQTRDATGSIPTSADAAGEEPRADLYGDADAKTDRLIFPREYFEGIRHFNEGRYFDAHEIWEEAWLRASGETKLFYQMLIQAAVGLHHYERGNHRGARGMYKNVLEKAPQLPTVFMSLDLADFVRQYKSFFAGLIESGDEALPDIHKPRPRIQLLSGEMNE